MWFTPRQRRNPRGRNADLNQLGERTREAGSFPSEFATPKETMREKNHDGVPVPGRCNPEAQPPGSNLFPGLGGARDPGGGRRAKEENRTRIKNDVIRSYHGIPKSRFGGARLARGITKRAPETRRRPTRAYGSDGSGGGRGGRASERKRATPTRLVSLVCCEVVSAVHFGVTHRRHSILHDRGPQGKLLATPLLCHSRNRKILVGTRVLEGTLGGGLTRWWWSMQCGASCMSRRP